MGAARGRCRRREARGARGRRHRCALREAFGGDGRQGDDRLHEPAHLHRPVQKNRRPAARLGAQGRRQGEYQGGDDRRGVRPARLAAAHPQQAAARGLGAALPQCRRPAAHRARARHVADRLRCAEPAHHVRRQADARPRADAGDRPRQPRVQGQAGRPRRRLPGHRSRAQARAQGLYRKRRRGRDRPRPGAGGAGHARKIRDMLRPVPRLRPAAVDRRRVGGGTVGTAGGGAGAHPDSGERQGALLAGGARAFPSFRAGRAARGSDAHPRRRGFLSGRAGGAVEARGCRRQDRRGIGPRRAPDRLAGRGAGRDDRHLRRGRVADARYLDPVR